MKIRKGDIVQVKPDYFVSEAHRVPLVVVDTFIRNKKEGQWVVCLADDTTVTFPVSMVRKVDGGEQ